MSTPFAYIPMKAVPSDKPFSSPDWVFERKLDGERCGALRRDGKITLLSRTRSVMDAAYSELVDVLSVKGPELSDRWGNQPLDGCNHGLGDWSFGTNATLLPSATGSLLGSSRTSSR